jgi:hypothetical protein
MRRALISAILFAILFAFFVSGSAFAQQPAPSGPPPVQRDPQATTILQAAVRAMGGTAPTDSVATGNITVVAGSQTSSGTIRILTRGTGQSSEQITLPQGTTAVTYSAGAGGHSVNSVTTSLPLERAVTSQSICFPLPFLAGALANADVSMQYVALETLGQKSVQHIRLRNTFASRRSLQPFADFAVFDVWLDAASSLPERISFMRRDGSGAVPRIPVATTFRGYQTVSGITYPSQIHVSLNGTPWASITISGVSFNTGLTDASFPVQ